MPLYPFPPYHRRRHKRGKGRRSRRRERTLREGGLAMTVSRARRDPWALGGVLFAAFFILGDVLRGILANGPLPLPGAPATEVARYFTESQTAVLAVALCQVLSALSLDRKSTRLNSSHANISYAVFCL